MESQKQENLLSLSLTATKEEREKSRILNVGINQQQGTYEVIVKYHGNLKALESETIKVEELLGGYAILTLPEAAISYVAALPMIEYMELPKSLVYDIYEAKQVSCVSPAENPPLGLTGEGVLLAVLDSGIDYFLEDFKKGRESRILYLWDQTGIPDAETKKLPPSGFTIGVEYDQEMLDLALMAKTREEAMRIVAQTDERGHGTAVTAVAASSNSNPLLRGVAPKSGLVIVKLRPAQADGFPSTTELMRGISYCIKKAQELNRPLVINLSFGNAYGPRDGSSLVEQFLDQAASRGRTCLCIGAGNEGVSAGHFSGNLNNIDRVELAIDLREPTVNVQLWKFYEDSFILILQAPDGERFQVPVSEGVGRTTFFWQSTRILVYSGEPSPYSTKQEIFFVFLPEGEYLDSGIWSFIFENKTVIAGGIQLYLPAAAQRNRGTVFLRQNPELTITNPATTVRAISVAAYNGRTGTYAEFSGRGEENGEKELLWEQRNKPDLAAPGVDIKAVAPGGESLSYSGTSFATPLVSGSAALLMEWGDGVIIRLS